MHKDKSVLSILLHVSSIKKEFGRNKNCVMQLWFMQVKMTVSTKSLGGMHYLS